MTGFSGSYMDWVFFYHPVKGAVIDNDQLPDSLELQYWKTALKWEASPDVAVINYCHRRHHQCGKKIFQNRQDNNKLNLGALIHGNITHRALPAEKKDKRPAKNY